MGVADYGGLSFIAGNNVPDLARHPKVTGRKASAMQTASAIIVLARNLRRAIFYADTCSTR
jgi:hypothetical protein